MARKIIDIGVVGNDGTGDSIRDSFRKVNDNFRELYSSLGLGENLTFINLDDTPATYIGQNDPITGATPVLTVNNTESGVAFKQLIPGTGISIDFTTNSNEIRINSEFSSVSGDSGPQLGGDLRARSGGNQYRIYELPPYNFNQNPPGGPILPTEATSKAYVDTKISRAGVNAIDPETLQANAAFGIMTGPLILSRDPEPDDDAVYDGLIAATKRYVDNAGFGSSVNLYVATSGQDERVGVSENLQGRALAYAYRTVEAALKKAEEIINESRPELGPYRKVLTYNSGATPVTLEKIDIAPASGSGFSGVALLSVENATLSSVGVNYNIGDILTVVGGTFIQAARFQVLTTATTPGAIVTFRTLSTGVYSSLPGTVVGGKRIVNLTATDAEGGTTFGSSAQMSLTFDVNNVEVLSGGSGYGLVSVRVAGGGGLGAFGTADISGGIIQSITITDRGSGFINLPNVIVNLPRFLLKTEFQRTDFTGDVTTSTPAAIRSRDVREGLYLRGETSGALAQILAHSGSLDSNGNEIFDVDIIYGTFLDAETYGVGEEISYGDVATQAQITILVESGIYEENFPLRVPANVAIVGDEFRRCIIRPKPGISSSPWAFLYFRRDLTVDGLTTATQNFGYHYLEDPSEPVYPLINNRGFYRSSAQLLKLNRSFLQEQITGWIDYQIENNISPFTAAFTYDRTLCQRDIGFIVDSMIFDLRYGGSDRTLSSGLKLKVAGNGLGMSVSTDLSRIIAGLERLNTLSQLIVKNITITELYDVVNLQIIDNAYVTETGATGATLSISNITRATPCIITTPSPHGLVDSDEIIINGVVGMTELNGNNYYVDVINSTQFGISEVENLSVLIDSSTFVSYTSGGTITIPGGVIKDLVDAIIDVISNSASVNYPLENDQLDLFLCNDAVIIRAVTGQGHGGFMMVLDPWGQILAKSPYAQECASFSKSTGRKKFTGGMFVDGFAGNIRFKILSKDSNTFLRVGGLARLPNLPASFIVNDTVYRINYIRDYTFNLVSGSPIAQNTASFVLDETTPWPFDVITYNESICRRDVGLIIDGLGYDVVLQTNYHARKAGLSYRQANAQVVIDDQLDITARAVLYAHTLAQDEVSSISGTAVSTVVSSGNTISNTIRNGSTFAPNLTLTNPPGVSTNIANAKFLLINNIDYIVEETIGWINAQIAGNISPFTTAFSYIENRWRTDTRKNVEALIYDILYGGNSQTRDAGRRYYDGVGDTIAWQGETGDEAETAAANDYTKYLAKQVVQNLPPAVSYSSEPRITGAAASGTEVGLIETLMSAMSTVITSGVGSLPAEVLPDLNAYSYVAQLKDAKTALDAAKTSIQDGTIDWIDDNINTFEVLMPGNRSMLSNDYTQINDLGYGVIATNGGLTEAVSMFTYYCQISYYSLNGGQIRSVGGSSAHGEYALVAEGSDPLEIPTPVNLFHELSQGVTCYFPSGLYANVADGLIIYVTGYTYIPLGGSELEIDHGYTIFRYTVTSVATAGLPIGVARLNLAASDDEGLFAVVPNGTPMTVRMNSTVVLTGDIVDVATRPSTGLVLNESDDVYRVLLFTSYADPAGAQTCTISFANPTTITKVNHELLPNYQITFSTTGVLPSGISVGEAYFILPDNFTENSFQISLTRNGTPVATTSAGSGTHSYTVFGLARTTLRENYNYIELSVWPEQPYRTTALTCTFTISSPTVITTSSPHGFNNGDAVRFSVSLGGTLPNGILATRLYYVANTPNPDEFTVDAELGGSDEAEATNSGSGTFFVQKVLGEIGDDEFAVVPVGPEEDRLLGTKFVFLGQEYLVTGYENELITNEAYALLRITPPLVNNVVQYNSLPVLKAGVGKGEGGSLTIRISLTRVTSHDLLEIGTGSYADTNYPSEIFGAPVNALDPAAETQERSVGRVFYVTTDQFGNFSVGPYFRVDQGTGTVTFSAAIALSNLDGIGFKRGVTISEFSTDPTFSDNATDTVPTEQATRSYIEKRLGLSHTGGPLLAEALIPSVSGGFMALNGLLTMKNDMNLGGYRVYNVGDPTNPQDAVNLRSMLWSNWQDADFADVKSADILTFTGAGNIVQNSTVVGDMTFNIDSTAHTVDAQINPGVILNADVNASAAIAQSKLAMNAATTRANATGIAQADRGLASFDDAQFTITDGWVTLKTNGTPLTAITQVPSDTVLGNSTGITNNITAVTFATVVDEGKALKKSNFTSVGFIRRKNASSFDGDTGSGITDSYEIIDAESTNIASTLVRRDSQGDFAGRIITGEQFKVDTRLLADSDTAGGGGVIKLYGYLGQQAILLGDGSLATDKRNYYDNDGHIFRDRTGTIPAPITCSTINASAITGTGSPSTVMTGTFTLATGSTLQATYADLAEYYESDREYSVGTVLIFGGDREVTASDKKQDHRVAGVVSDNAALIMNENCPGQKILIALQGRVPCKVVGKITKGDLMITSGVPGVAVSAGGDARAGTIIGKALENYDSDHIGTIEVAVGRA